MERNSHLPAQRLSPGHGMKAVTGKDAFACVKVNPSITADEVEQAFGIKLEPGNYTMSFDYIESPSRLKTYKAIATSEN